MKELCRGEFSSAERLCTRTFPKAGFHIKVGVNFISLNSSSVKSLTAFVSCMVLLRLEDCNVILAIAVVIGRDGDVTRRAVSEWTHTTDVPGTVGWAEDSNVGLTIAVVISRDGDVAHCAIEEGPDTADIPCSVRGTEDGNVCLA